MSIDLKMVRPQWGHDEMLRRLDEFEEKSRRLHSHGLSYERKSRTPTIGNKITNIGVGAEITPMKVGT